MIDRRHRKRSGGTAVEFAIVAGAFLLFVLLLLETAFQLAVGAALDYGARDASRFGVTGRSSNPDDPGQRLDDIAARVVARTSPVLDFGRLSLTAESFATPAGEAAAGFLPIGTGQPGTLGDPGGGFAIVRYTLTYEQPLLTPFARLILGRDAISHRATIIVKNEPFPSGGGA